MAGQTDSHLRKLALIGNLAATAATLYISFVIGTGGSLPVVGSVGPSIVWAVVFFTFGSAAVTFVFKMAFFAIAAPIMLAGERAEQRA